MSGGAGSSCVEEEEVVTPASSPLETLSAEFSILGLLQADAFVVFSSSEEEASTVLGILQHNGIDTSSYIINKIEHYTIKGLGRDPDLH